MRFIIETGSNGFILGGIPSKPVPFFLQKIAAFNSHSDGTESRIESEEAGKLHKILF